MKRLVRLFQLFNFHRTAKMEAQMERMQAAMLELLEASMRLAVQHNADQPYAEFVEYIDKMHRALGIIDGVMASGRIDEARNLIGDLVAATCRTGTNG